MKVLAYIWAIFNALGVGVPVALVLNGFEVSGLTASLLTAWLGFSCMEIAKRAIAP